MSNPARARELAVEWHCDQKYAGEPYVRHLDEVATLCRPFGARAEIVAYLHDVLEDTPLPPAQLEEIFGAEIRALVEALSDPPLPTRKERKAASHAKLGAIAVASPLAEALIVKAADRLANVRACVSEGNASLLAMYQGEQAAFDRAVRRAGLNDGMMDEVAACLRSDAH